MGEAPLYVCEVNDDGGVKYYLTLLPPDVIRSKGLVPEAIVGSLLRLPSDAEGITPDIFARNGVFKQFMHDVIARYGPEQPDCSAEAKRLGNGWVFVVDRRTKTPGGSVPPHDILGCFEAKDGQVVPGSYQANPNHRILSDDGFFRLTEALHERLLHELARYV
jgi:hypothetical protein